MESKPADLEILTLTDSGLYCGAGGFFIDPWNRVDRAVITHAHSDHARPGAARYLCARPGEHVLRIRVGAAAVIETLAYGETVDCNGVRLSFHPAGHVLGSAQIRLERAGRVVVVSGDYKIATDPTCDPFEPVACHVFVTESTFGLPIYRWPPAHEVFAEINAWWNGNRKEGRASLILGYSLGKAQRILSGIDCSIGPIYVHGAIDVLNAGYRAAGVRLPEAERASSLTKGADWSQSLIVAPPSAWGSPWVRTFGEISAAAASGWMRIRGARRRRGTDRGFVLSDHADWPGLMAAIDATGAEKVLVTHGYSDVVARRLRERGLNAQAIVTRFEGEPKDEPEIENAQNT